MAAPIRPEQIAIVKATAPVLREHGETITTVFYQNMIRENPGLKNMFSLTSQANGRQPRALAASVLAYATYIDDLPKLQHAVERIAHKHVSLQVTAGQYDIVGKYLIQAIGQVLKEAATPAIVDAWAAAYGALAQVFIGIEAKMYAANRADGWAGWRKFRVARKVAESDCVTSLYLAPSDGCTPLPRYLPGQYVSLQLAVPGLGVLQSRQYSLSEPPTAAGEYYRVSVKREAGGEPPAGVPGVISSMVHDGLAAGDEVELSHPQGEFFADPRDAGKAGMPAVLVSAGVGATPLMAILGALAPAGTGLRGVEAPAAAGRPVAWIQAAQSAAAQPFGETVRAVCRENERVSAHVFLKEVGAGDGASEGYELDNARLDLSRLDPERDLFLGDGRAEYFVCGPEGFMADVRGGLLARGVGRERIFLELFATGDMTE